MARWDTLLDVLGCAYGQSFEATREHVIRPIMLGRYGVERTIKGETSPRYRWKAGTSAQRGNLVQCGEGKGGA